MEYGNDLKTLLLLHVLFFPPGKHSGYRDVMGFPYCLIRISMFFSIAA